MSASNSLENSVLLLYFNNSADTSIGDAGGLLPSSAAGSFYVSLHTADPGEAGNQTSSETAYTNYARQAIARSATGWTISGTAPTQAANATSATSFPTCGVTGATLTYVGIGTASSGAGRLLWSGILTSSLVVGSGVTPSFAIGALVVTND